MDYNSTLQLPKTDFPMRAGLPVREPKMLENWLENDLYESLMAEKADKPLFILHDGPPFSNGDIHMGHALNKILKDFVLRYKNMSGYRAPYIPGWDNHGMPIESAIIKAHKLDRDKMSVPDFRDACRNFAMDFVNKQSTQFQRLGILGDWKEPYLTMDPKFEAEEIKIFGEMFEKGYIYKGKKPVYWCAHDRTALAEAEIEYADDKCESIYVKFAVEHEKLCGYNLSKISFVIWTTTAWTLPANLAISLHPDFEYILCKHNSEGLIIAKSLKENVQEAANLPEMPVLACFKGKELENIKAKHPFYDRDSLIIVGEHVTAEAGTGCVHTAPGHGADDYFACKPYNLPILVPVDDYGRMTAEAGEKLSGLTTAQANEVIMEILRENGALLCSKELIHQYPHCWRCHKPILFRATEQWFASVDAIKDIACAEADKVTWYPDWGRERMNTMIRERADWCISRQRNWGLPIPVIYCEKCNKPIVTRESIEKISERFAAEGSNAWYGANASEFLPDGFCCPDCGHSVFTKEKSTLDGWFDSGSTHVLLRTRKDHRWPADLYLEGSDQYRGWFQSSLLTAVATKDCAAPYKSVSTNGWVTDREGNKMSKSKGNGMDPMGICDKYGADILRLWVSSVDYHSDVFFSADTFTHLSEIYLKIRNTARFLLGNLNGFSPDSTDFELSELDQWTLYRLGDLTRRVTDSYNKYEYHTIFHAVHNFCVIDMSNFYLDIVKDRLYCDAENSPSRRAVQHVLYRVLSTLVRLIAPILAYTSEEIWSFMPHTSSDAVKSVLFNEMPPLEATSFVKKERWDRLIAIRLDVNKALEDARAAKTIGKSLEAAVSITCDGEDYAVLREYELMLKEIFIVSKVTILQGERSIFVSEAPGGKCARCWGYFEDLGTDLTHPELCPRCTNAVK